MPNDKNTMKLKLACADFTFPLVSHDQSLDLIQMLGFEGVDIGLFENRSHLWPSKEFRSLPRSARRLARRVHDRGLVVADVFLQMNPEAAPYAPNHPQASRRRKTRNWFCKSLDYANYCGAKHVTFLPGVRYPEETREKSYARCLKELPWYVEQAQSHEIIFGVEPHIGSIAARPQQALKLVRDVPGLTFTLDYTHFTRSGISDADVEPLLPLTSHFHVRGARRGRLQVNFKDNVIDYRRILRQMKRVGYRGWLGIEYVRTEWERCNESDNLCETILYRDFIRKIMKKI